MRGQCRRRYGFGSVLALGLSAFVAGMGVSAAAEPATQPATQPAVASVKVEDAAKPRGTVRKPKKADVLVTGSIGAPPPIRYRGDAALEHWYVERGNVAQPTSERLPFCHAYNCLLRATVRITDEDIAELRAIFEPRSGSAEAEREAINLAVSWFEKRAQPLLGGPPDVRGSDLAHSGLAGQTDCLDEATNSTTMLIFLQREGFLRYHRVERPTSRGGLLLGLAHATAVFQDPDGKDWVVDSWMRDMGDPNDVMPLETWESSLF